MALIEIEDRASMVWRGLTGPNKFFVLIVLGGLKPILYDSAIILNLPM